MVGTESRGSTRLVRHGRVLLLRGGLWCGRHVSGLMDALLLMMKGAPKGGSEMDWAKGQRRDVEYSSATTGVLVGDPVDALFDASRATRGRKVVDCLRVSR